MNSDSLWGAKLWAWLHDPAEKALVLMRREGGGHEEGSVAALRGALFPDAADSEKATWDNIAKTADRLAAAADRPQFPYSKTDPSYPAWAKVIFPNEPELVHPLSGERIRLDRLDADISWREAESASFSHLSDLRQLDPAGQPDRMRTALALWRFAPETPFERLGALWQLLPADTRVPDHSIFAHLDLVSALAGAIALDKDREPALLVVSLGPVQDFIAAARKTSDLWAGSHFLSRLSWEAMKVVASRLGPDAVLFPALRGVPLVDRWLSEELGVAQDRSRTAPWRCLKSDANPLFTAALPNKFVALVPSDQAESLAAEITSTARAWALAEAQATVRILFDNALISVDTSPGFGHALRQAVAQLNGFPEVHWAAVPWSLAKSAGPGKPVETGALRAALAPFFPGGNVPFFDPIPGSPGHPLWELLSRQTEIDGQRFFSANRGALYSEYYRLAEFGLSAAKSLRPFDQLVQSGYRCTLCGEREWITDDPSLLHAHRGRAPLWDKQPLSVVRKNASGAAAERLCAWCTLKRLWPKRFTGDVANIVGASTAYSVSTHTVALAPLLALAPGLDAAAMEKLRALDLPEERTALPFRLNSTLADRHPARFIPAWLDNTENEDEAGNRRAAIKGIFGAPPDEYFALALLDGDEMGSWVSGDPSHTLEFRQSWHSKVENELANRARQNPELNTYVHTRRPASPARHAAISDALNNFALHAAPFAVERAHNGKLIYAGGDDVMAMLPVSEALSTVTLLRLLYSGIGDEMIRSGASSLLPDAAAELRWSRNGFWLTRHGGSNRLLRMMGPAAGLSGGLVIAHHQTPLGAVLRAVRSAEDHAKNYRRSHGLQSGALSIALLKRSGGETRLDVPFWIGDTAPKLLTQTGPGLLAETARWLSQDVSRRLAYHLHERLPLLPNRTQLGSVDELREMLESTFLYQAGRQQRPDADRESVVVRGLVALAFSKAAGTAPPGIAAPETGAAKARPGPDPAVTYLLDWLTLAEFLAREERLANPKHAVAAAGVSR